MKFEDLIRKVRPGYVSKRELKEKLALYLDVNKKLSIKVVSQETRPREITARYNVPRNLYKEMCMTGRYSLMKHKVRTALAEQLVQELAPALPVDMQPVEYPASEDNTFEFTARLLYIIPPETGRDVFFTASEIANE